MKTSCLCALLLLIGLTGCSPKGDLPPGDAPRLSSKRGYVGLPKENAIMKAWSAGATYRIVKEDGQPRRGTRDKRPERLNFTIEEGVVVKVTKG